MKFRPQIDALAAFCRETLAWLGRLEHQGHQHVPRLLVLHESVYDVGYHNRKTTCLETRLVAMRGNSILEEA